MQRRGGQPWLAPERVTAGGQYARRCEGGATADPFRAGSRTLGMRNPLLTRPVVLAGGLLAALVSSDPLPAQESRIVRGHTVGAETGAPVPNASIIALAEDGAVRRAAVDNLFDAEWNEAQFATTSRLRAETTPVTQLHFPCPVPQPNRARRGNPILVREIRSRAPGVGHREPAHHSRRPV